MPKKPKKTRKRKKAKVKRRPGRPTKLTPEVHDRIIAAVRAGNYIEVAAAHAGIHKDSLYEWMKRGAREKQRVAKDGRHRIRKDEADFVKFSDALQKAIGDAEMRDVLLIGKAAESQWQAAAWRLERKFPDRWGRRDKQTVEHKGELKVTNLADAVRRASASSDEPTGDDNSG